MASKKIGVLLAGLLMLGAISFAHADAFQQIISDLKSHDEQTRANAVRALGESRDRRALEPLLDALRDDSALVRKHALAALRNLVRVLDDISRIMQWWLRDLLDRLGIEPREEVILTHAIAYQGGPQILS